MEILEFLKEKVVEDGYEPSEGNILELLLSAKEIEREHLQEHRWYDEWFIIVKIDEKFIRFVWYTTTSDYSIYDMGIKFDMNSIVEVFPHEVTTIIYVPEEK